MNNCINQEISARQARRKGKIRDLLLTGGLALLIVFASWRIFGGNQEESKQTGSVTQTEAEQKVSRILEEIEGVGEAEVMICQTQDGVEGVVVVCEGAKNIKVVMDIREAVSAALGTKQSAVKIYLKKE